MNRITVAIGIGLAAATVAACQPKPPPAPVPVKPQCGPVSVVHEGKPLPCIPGKGDRLDFIMAGPVTPASPANVRTAASARCQDVPLVGAPYWLELTPGNLASRVLTCRTAVVP